MKLSNRTLTKLAEMICGSAGGAGFLRQNFRYRSSTYLTEFFKNCDLEFTHDGSTRKRWVLNVLEQLNIKPASHSQFPADDLLRVIQELMDPVDFETNNLNRSAALEDINIAASTVFCVSDPAEAAGRPPTCP